ncbi:FAD-binding domain-containing protein [Trametes gibbosa]|nr:FAD-binding domain-containing protein [Trametes gibbosa]
MRQSLAVATCLGAILVNALPSVADAVEARGDNFKSVCKTIENAVSSASSVHYPGLDFTYFKDISHWGTSSTDLSACSVEPGTAEDVGTILQILGKTKTPFAVKGGGHTSNAGFSSTPGVQIAMYKFSGVTYHADANTAEIGAGLIWDDVYEALAPYGVNVVGGRVSGVGVAGFTLGGGYSWKTNQHGLTIDNLTGFEVVLPNGTVAAVTQASFPDLFFGLKGGFNNFGIVTKFNLTTHPQTQVWGGLITITEDQLNKANDATVKFSQTVTDPKAQVLPTYNFVLGEPGLSLLLFYDAPTVPAGIFDDYLAIPHFTKDVKTREFLDLVQSFPANISGGERVAFHTVSLLDYTDKIMDAVLNETKFWGSQLSLQGGTFFSYDVEPFLPSILSHAPEGSSAYPPSRARGLLPLNIFFSWPFEISDSVMQDAVRHSAAHLTQVIIAEGQDIDNAALYGNYALFDTPTERIFGDNLPKLQEIKAKYDPENVMGLAGGWKI